jgi:hypothetical protein
MAEFRKELLRTGNGLRKPKLGDLATVEYEGWLYDETQPANRGKQ